MESSRAYNGFVVVVNAVRKSPKTLTRNPVVTITAHNTGKCGTSLYSTREFFYDEDAEVHGFNMAEEWIQTRVTDAHR